MLKFSTIAKLATVTSLTLLPISACIAPEVAPKSVETSENSGHMMSMLPVEKRVAFMSGHVEAGLALYRAGAPEQAAKHLLHPVSETHEAERAGLSALGFEQDLFIAVSDALDEGLPAAEIEPQLAAAEANMALMRANAGGDPAEIIDYLMDTVLEEYQIGVVDGKITDPGEYQDAYGFTVVALSIASDVDSAGSEPLMASLEQLLKLWPDHGPLAASTPSPVSEISTHVAKVKNALQ